MSPLLLLLLAGAVAAGYRLSFTALADPARLPDAIRDRLDVVGPATFAAILGAQLSGGGMTSSAPTVAGLVVAAVGASRGWSYAGSVGGAVVTAALLSLVSG